MKFTIPIDLELVETVKLGIVTLQAEGVHVQTMLATLRK
jgi:hypothetical protein